MRIENESYPFVFFKLKIPLSFAAKTAARPGQVGPRYFWGSQQRVA